MVLLYHFWQYRAYFSVRYCLKDYLSRLRCERAKEILDAQPDIKLAQLGEQVGILNVNTLIRVFKKYTGVSPGQYQRGRQAEPAAKLGEN